MEGFYNLRNELKERFHASAGNNPSEEEFIEFVNLALCKGGKFDAKALEVVVDLAIAVMDENGNLKHDLCDTTEATSNTQETINCPTYDLSPYDADDESSDETFIFPCHMTYENCHPEYLMNYYSDHVRSSREPIQIIKHSKLCEFIFKFLYNNLRSQSSTDHSSKATLDDQRDANNYNVIKGFTDSSTLEDIISSIVAIVQRLDRVCSLEKNNCRNLSTTGLLDSIFDIITVLVENHPQKQKLFLETLLKFAFTLADYRITSHNLRQLFCIIKEEKIDLDTVLSCFEEILSRHDRICKNIQPLQSINFPAASTTARDINNSSYVSNSWHWRLRRKVIEAKRKHSRSSESQNSSAPATEQYPREQETFEGSCSPSWLECSFMTPLCNVTPIIHDGHIKFSCSLWISICGDLFVLDRPKQNSPLNTTKEASLSWKENNGHWLKLTSKRRLANRFKCKSDQKVERNSLTASKKRGKYDKEDEELEEEEEEEHRLKREGGSSSPSRPNTALKLSSLNQIRTKISKSNQKLNKVADSPPLIRNTREIKRKPHRNSRELMLHIVSFAIDTLTIEVWLNVKKMTFTAKACRVGRDGQTNLLDQVIFPSHLEANGNWSNLVLCFEETSESPSQLRRVLHLKFIIDCVHNETEKLVYNTNKNPFSNFACLLGCERSSFGYVWKLAHVSIFKSIPTKEVVLYLMGKGPDFWTQTNLKSQSSLPMADLTKRSAKSIFKPKILDLYSRIDEGFMQDWFTKNMLSIYVSHRPLHYLDYSRTTINTPLAPPLPADHDAGNGSERFIRAEILNFSRSLKFNVHQGFGPALVGAGGIESVMICFADMIRRCPNNPKIHSLALSVQLKMTETNQSHTNKFLDELNGLKLIEFLLIHPDCSVSRSMLDIYFDFCLVKKGNHQLVKSPKLLFHFISCWKAWHKDKRVAKRFYQKLISLIQPKEISRKIEPEIRKIENFYHSHNSKMFEEAGGIDLLIGILKECLVPLDDGSSRINPSLIQLIVNLVSILIKHPPGLDVMYEIMEFLTFIHPDPKAFVDATSDRTSFFHAAQSLDGFRSWTGNSSNFSVNMLSEATVSEQNSSENISRNQHLEKSRNEMLRSSSDLFRVQDEHTSDRLSENLENFIARFDMHPKFRSSSEDRNSTHDHQLNPSILAERCTNRSYALALVADMLASIVKLTSSDPMKILSEALSKPIIDPRKLVILANNSSSLVRERVLRLFLYCIRACYNLDLKNVLAKYEQDFKRSKFKICIPIQLMSCQLLKYPTTFKMIQLCYSIIVGVDDFEAIETVCLIFDVDTIDNNLQLNILILLIQLMAQLQKPAELISALKFVHTYLRQLVAIGQGDVLTILIENNLIDSLMKMYYYYVDAKSSKIKTSDGNQELADDSQADEYNQIRNELDNTLILIVRYISQNLQTSEALKSLEDLITYFNLMNSYVPSEYHYILRDCQVKVLAMAMKYCKLYESNARQRIFGGKMEYYFRTIFKNTLECTYPNTLKDSQLDVEYLLDDEYKSGDRANPSAGHQGEYFNGGGSENSSDSIIIDDEGLIGDTYYAKRTISEFDLIERYRTTVSLAVNFIITREVETIPSPLERRFILKTLEMMSSLLDDHQKLVENQVDEASLRCHWYRLVPKLEKRVRVNFSRLTLYLLSPSDSMNLDERKYYALKLLEMFTVDHLLKLLDDYSNGNTYRIMCLFLDDLVQYDSPYSSDDSVSDHDDDIIYDVKVKLISIVTKMKQLLGIDKGSSKSNGELDSKLDATNQKYMNSTIDPKIRDIWLLDLAQTKEETREKFLSFKLENQSFFGTSVEGASGDSNSILDEAVRVTHDVVNNKHEQRKEYLEDLKQDKVFTYHIRQQWLSLIIGQTHERAAWYNKEHYPSSWELNPVEGPSRIRSRLRPCKLILNSRYFRSKSPSSRRGSSNTNQSPGDLYYREDVLPDDWYNRYSPHPLCSMVLNHEQSVNTTELRARMFTTDKINFNCDCSIIRPDDVCRGEISIASWCMHFIGQRIDSYQQRLAEKSTFGEGNSSRRVMSASKPNIYLNLDGSMAITVVEDLWFDEIVEIWDRRHQLKDVGLEMFMTNNMTYLLSFRRYKDREDFKQSLMREQHKMINLQRTNLTASLNRVTQLWREGRMTNFDLLTSLNKLAGRSFNDLMQYPVFPFILANYTSETLNLNLEKSFRNLKKPMAIQNPEKEINFIQNYNDSGTSNMFMGICSMTKPYHYGNHYSNTASVLHFLVRLPPFTQMLIQYQDNNFDQPDRTFHSIANTWQLITNDSNTDFKELIPEFFFLPEMFINFEQFELGRKQNNELVDDVRLPLWCPNQDARLFTLIHRQSLESTYVSDNLHYWIDLIFGSKQTGKAAVEALNVFHPATYYGMITFDSDQESSASSAILSSPLYPASAKSSSHNSSNIREGDTSDIGQHQVSAERCTEPPDGRKLRNSRKAHEDIERMALETMIKTYGQMPRQLFAQPMRPRADSSTLNLVRTRRNSSIVNEPADDKTFRKIEPLKQVIGLRWGSFVGSPDEGDIIAIRHKQISSSGFSSPQKSNSHKKDAGIRYYLSLLPNGDVAVMRNNTSLMLDYRADRKSGGGYLLSLPSTRYTRRAGLSNVARMNLFSNMIISRQQFAYVQPAYVGSANYESSKSNPTSFVSASKSKFSLETLSKISWSFLDGTIRIRHPVSNPNRPSVPLVQSESSIDSMSTCVSVPELNLLIIGYRSGSLCAHIVSTSDEVVATMQSSSSSSSSSLIRPQLGLSGASALHFIDGPSSPSILTDVQPLASFKKYNPLNSEQLNSAPLSGKALQTVKSLTKATRWLYCHTKRINSIQINVGFGIVVSASDDGTSVIWDLNSLCYVRTIDYSVAVGSLDKRSSRTPSSKHKRPWGGQLAENSYLLDFLCTCGQNDPLNHINRTRTKSNSNHVTNYSKPNCSCCNTGVSLIAISDTLGDIATVKHFSDRVGMATDSDASVECNLTSYSGSMSANRNVESNQDDTTSASVIYVHTINGYLVGLVNLHTKVTALCYSSAPEGISVNVIAVGLDDGLIRLYSSWDLSRVKEFHISGLSSPPSSLLYSRDNQLLYVVYVDGQMIVLRNKGRNSVSFPKDWLL